MRLTHAPASVSQAARIEDAPDVSPRAPIEASTAQVTVKVAVSATAPDWSREELPRHGLGEPSRRLLRTIRRYQCRLSAHAGKRRGFFGRIVHRYYAFKWRFWSIVTGADIPLNCQIGGGLLLPHPNGVVIHPHAVIGPNCLMFQGVTIGCIKMDGGCPKIGGHVDIASGAKVLGNVRIGNHARIGPNCVIIEGMLDDIPAGATVLGNPGKIVSVAKIEEMPVERNSGN